MASVARAKKADEPPTPAPETAADRIRRVAAEQLARHDDPVRTADIKPGDPIEPVLVASRGLIEWTAEMAGAMADAARPLSPEAEQLLAERVGTLASAAVKAEAWRFARGVMARTILLASAGIAALMVAAGGGGYWLGVRESTLTFQVRPGERSPQFAEATRYSGRAGWPRPDLRRLDQARPGEHHGCGRTLTRMRKQLGRRGMRKTLAVMIVLTGCASSVDNLQRASAVSIGKNIVPENIRISDVQRGITDVRWTATPSGGPTYVCSADDMVRHPSCARQ